MIDGSMFFNKRNFVTLHTAFAAHANEVVEQKSPLPLDKYLRMQRKYARMVWDTAGPSERLNLFTNYVLTYGNMVREAMKEVK